MYKLSGEESNRISIVKFLAIVFVVYIHSYSGAYIKDYVWIDKMEQFGSQVLVASGVPLFFFMSSILLFQRERKYAATIKNKIKTLVIPYVFWNSFWLLLMILLQELPITARLFAMEGKSLLRSSASEWISYFGLDGSYPYCFPLWFMRDLFLISLLFPIIRWIVKKYPLTVLVVSVCCFCFGMSGRLITTEMLWFVDGAAIVQLDWHMEKIDRIPLWIGLVVYGIGAVVTTFFAGFAGIFIIIGILFWIRTSKLIYENEKLRDRVLQLSGWTFFIYVFHELTQSCLRKVIYSIAGRTWVVYLLTYFFLPIIVIGICIVIGTVFKKIFPKLYSFSMGQRR